MMKQREMRAKLVALRREMFAALAVEEGEIFRAEQRGDDDRRLQIST
jgi:hypothetical protein